MFEKRTTPVEIPATTVEKTEYVCVVCKETFTDESAAKRHYGNTHSFTDTRRLAGYLGEDADLSSDLRGSIAYHFETKEGFEAFQGYQDSYGSKEWIGPGWYVDQGGWRSCGRCGSSGCGHNVIVLVSLQAAEVGLTSHFKEVVARLRNVRKLLGPKCSECAEYNGKHERWCNAQRAYSAEPTK